MDFSSPVIWHADLRAIFPSSAGQDLIISGGLNVYPKEVEDQQTKSSVQESAYSVLIPFGEAVTAVIVSNHNTFSEELILEHLRPKLASFKLPKRILPVSELPRNSMEKCRKNCSANSILFLPKLNA